MDYQSNTADGAGTLRVLRYSEIVRSGHQQYKGAFIAALIAFALNSGAFISEIVKGALMGIDPGQKEAGASLGLTSTQTMLHLVIPPAFKSALPALFNQFITSVKDTALLSAIAVNEITHQAQAYAALSFKAIPTYTALAVFYLIILSILIIVQKQIERKMR